MDILLHIRERVATKAYQISLHAEREREAEAITVQEIEESVAEGELLEDYPEDRRGHSCLLLGFTAAGKAIHTVWGVLSNGRVRLITVYLPLPPNWINPRERLRGD